MGCRSQYVLGLDGSWEGESTWVPRGFRRSHEQQSGKAAGEQECREDTCKDSLAGGGIS